MLPAVGGKLPDIFPPATESGTTHMRKERKPGERKKKASGEAAKKGRFVGTLYAIGRL